MRLDEHQFDQLLLHQAGLAAHLCLDLKNCEEFIERPTQWRALYAAEAPAQCPGEALSEANSWLLAISRLGRIPGSMFYMLPRPLLTGLAWRSEANQWLSDKFCAVLKEPAFPRRDQ